MKFIFFIKISDYNAYGINDVKNNVLSSYEIRDIKKLEKEKQLKFRPNYCQNPEFLINLDDVFKQ